MTVTRSPDPRRLPPAEDEGIPASIEVVLEQYAQAPLARSPALPAPA
jgi:hypothetical protein